jgi:hypothetical protein
MSGKGKEEEEYNQSGVSPSHRPQSWPPHNRGTSDEATSNDESSFGYSKDDSFFFLMPRRRRDFAAAAAGAANQERKKRRCDSEDVEEEKEDEEDEEGGGEGRIVIQTFIRLVYVRGKWKMLFIQCRFLSLSYIPLPRPHYLVSSVPLRVFWVCLPVPPPAFRARRAEKCLPRAPDCRGRGTK